MKISKERLTRIIKEEVLQEGILQGQGIAKNIAEKMSQLTRTLSKFELSSLEDPRFVDAVGCLQEAWVGLQAAGAASLGNLENMDGECPKRRRISEKS